jgi:pimeloyl-ACP methyl ester carboxylesterase
MFKEIGDVNVRYEVEGEGYPLILMHGGQMRIECWEEMVPELSKKYKVWRYDARGHGQTKRPPGSELSHDLWADDLAAFMDTFGIEKAAVAGWSMGAAIGLNFAVQHPSRLSHLILIGAGSPLSPPTDRSGFDRRRQMKEAGATGEEIMDETFVFTKTAFADASLKNRPAGVQRVRELLAAHYSLPIEEMSIPSRARSDIGPRLGEIQCPTLILVGNEDNRTPVVASESLSTAIPNSYMRIIPDCGHNYAFEQPEVTIKSMMDFLKAFS